MFNVVVASKDRCKNYESFLESHEEKLNKPASESLIVLTLLHSDISWDIETHRTIHDNYFRKRPRPKGIHAPRIIEAALSLKLAERYRDHGDIAACKEILAEAINNFPEHKRLRELETVLEEISPISWTDILLEKPE